MSKNNLYQYASQQDEAHFSDKYSRINKRNNDMASSSSSSKKSPFLGKFNDMSLVVEEHGNQDKTAKSSIDSRLLTLVEFFRQLYIRKREVIKKIFPDQLHDDFEEIFNKFTDAWSLGRSEEMNQNQTTTSTRSLQRSLSVGSPRPRSLNGDESPLRLERFKVRTVVTGGGVQGGKGDSNSGGGGGSK